MASAIEVHRLSEAEPLRVELMGEGGLKQDGLNLAKLIPRAILPRLCTGHEAEQHWMRG